MDMKPTRKCEKLQYIENPLEVGPKREQIDLKCHGILKGLFQTLKVREFYIFFVQVMEYQGI